LDSIVVAIINEPTLVLNKNWKDVNVCTVSRALSLVWNESAKIVDHDYQLYDWPEWSKLKAQDGESVIRSARNSFRVPEVVVLTTYDRVPVAAVTFSRRNIFKRDHYTCQYCGIQPNQEDLTIDHVVPRASGGVSSWTNCVLACVDCNKRKADMPLAKSGFKLRKQPVRPAWKPLYAAPGIRKESWAKFISDAYWSVGLQK